MRDKCPNNMSNNALEKSTKLCQSWAAACHQASYVSLCCFNRELSPPGLKTSIIHYHFCPFVTGLYEKWNAFKTLWPLRGSLKKERGALISQDAVRLGSETGQESQGRSGRLTALFSDLFENKTRHQKWSHLIKNEINIMCTALN